MSPSLFSSSFLFESSLRALCPPSFHYTSGSPVSLSSWQKIFHPLTHIVVKQPRIIQQIVNTISSLPFPSSFLFWELIQSDISPPPYIGGSPVSLSSFYSLIHIIIKHSKIILQKVHCSSFSSSSSHSCTPLFHLLPSPFLSFLSLFTPSLIHSSFLLFLSESSLREACPFPACYTSGPSASPQVADKNFLPSYPHCGQTV